MSKKSLIFSTLLLLTIVSVNYLSFTSVNINIMVVNEQNCKIIETLSNPKSSGYAVTSKWNLTTGENVYSVAVSADGEYMVIGTEFGTGKELTLKKTSTNETIWTYDIGCNIYNVAISSDGSRIVAGYDSMETYELFLFNNSISAGNKEPMWKFDTGNDCYWVDISANGKYIVAGTENQGLYLFNDSIPAGAKQPVWNKGAIPSGAGPEHVAISADGEYIVAGYAGGGAGKGVWFFNNSYHSGTNKLPEWNYTTGFNVNSVAISATGEYVVAGTESNTAVDGDEILIFNNTVAPIKLPEWGYNTNDYGIDSVAMSADGEFFATAGETDGRCEILYLNNLIHGVEWDYNLSSNLATVDMTADGKYIVVGNEYKPSFGTIDENTIHLFNNTNTPAARKLPEWVFNTSIHVNSVSISAWGNYIGAGGQTLTGGGMALCFYHARPIPTSFVWLLGDDDDDDGDDEPAIPLGSYYLLFAILAIAALTLIYKRKTILNKR